MIGVSLILFLLEIVLCFYSLFSFLFGFKVGSKTTIQGRSFYGDTKLSNEYGTALHKKVRYKILRRKYLRLSL